MSRAARVLVWVAMGLFVVLSQADGLYGCRRGQGPLTACHSNLKNIGTALEMYSTDWSGHYPRNLQQLVPNYIKELPECPSAGYMSYRADFGLQAPGNNGQFQDYYFMECAGDHHADDGLPPNYPQYTGIEGLLDGCWR